MPAPDTWSAPVSGGTATYDNQQLFVAPSYANGYWFALSGRTTRTTVELRYTTDPTGTWSSVTLPTAPTGYTTELVYRGDHGVVYGDGTWAFVINYMNASNVFKHRIIYTTDPTGTWSSYEFDATDTYRPLDFIYADGKFVMVGRYDTGGTAQAFIGYCTTATGTWTFVTGASATGYDPTGVSLWQILGIDFDGTTWVTIADRSGTSAGEVRYSTSLTSGWAAPTSTPIAGDVTRVRAHANGWWTISDNFTPLFAYTDTPSGTWSSLGTAQMPGLSFAGNMAWANGYWVATGSDNAFSSDPYIGYLASSGSPSGTYTDAVSNFTDPSTVTAPSVATGDGYFVAASDYFAELRYCYLPDRSPKYRRAIGSGYRLRQRQTPFIT